MRLNMLSRYRANYGIIKEKIDISQVMIFSCYILFNSTSATILHSKNTPLQVKVFPLN